MANKGQKFKSYSNEFKQKIVNEHFNNQQSCSVLSKMYGVSLGTVKTWIFKTQKGNNVCLDNRGRPKNNQEIDYKEKYEILKNYQAFLKAQREKK